MKREATHPQEALATYKKLLVVEVDTATGFYYDALWQLDQIRRVYRTLDRDADFAAYVAELRERYARKRKFITELNQHLR